MLRPLYLANAPSLGPSRPHTLASVFHLTWYINSILMDSDNSSASIISISSDGSDDSNFTFFEFKVQPAHYKTLTILLALWKRHRLDSKQRVYMRFGDEARSSVMDLKYTHERRRGCSDSIKPWTGWPRFYVHCGMVRGQIWRLTIVSNMHGPQRTDFLFQADVVKSKSPDSPPSL